MPESPPHTDNTSLRRFQLESMGAFHGILGKSDAMLAVYNKIATYGPAEAPVLISGETGTGKELIARALHARSLRRTAPFVALNCTALNEELFESELFGHEKGAFTGAMRTHKGRFERADSGTLFLDEIGDMSLRVQAKLLRALEEGTIERVGAEEERKVDVRVVAATNISLDAAVHHKQFRMDLFHRLAVFRIHVPALRERPSDIPMLVESFLLNLNKRYGRNVERVTPEAMRALQEYEWPGNVRELRNVLERVYVETQTNLIGRNALAEWERERELLAAGDWNLELLEQQRMNMPMFIVPTGQPAQPYRILPALPAAPNTNAQQPNQTPGYALANRPPVTPMANAYQDPAALIYHDNTAPYRDLNAPIDVQYTIEPTTNLPRKRRPIDEPTIREAFNAAQGNATRAAEMLGVHKTTLYRNMKKLGLDRAELERE